MTIKLKIVTFLIITCFFKSYSQFDKKLIYKDGKELVGSFKEKKGDYIIYRKSKESKKIKIKKELIYSCEYKIEDSIKEVYYKRREGEKDFFGLSKLAEGSVEFFCLTQTYYTGMGYSSGNNYYIGKQNEDFVKRITHGPKFKKFEEIMIEYFGNCLELIDKVKSRDFGLEIQSIKSIVKYYNTKCN